MFGDHRSSIIATTVCRYCIIESVPVMSDEASLLSSAQDYVAWDPCEQTRAEVRAALEARDLPALRRLLGQRLLFGTAGLRGPMGAGYNAMNYLVIIQTTQGVIEYLRQTVGEEVAKKQVGIHIQLCIIAFSISCINCKNVLFLRRE